MSLNSSAATQLLARTHWRILANKLGDNLRHDKIKSATIALFLVIYGIAAYALVAAGLGFVHKLPLLGPLLTERLVYVLFFFFFVMLVISNATITSISLFRRKEMEWQVALPIPVRGIVMWKTMEGVFLASWGLLILSAPILVALGRVFHAGWLFYTVGALAMVCLVSIAAHLSTWLLLIIVRFAKRWWGVGRMEYFLDDQSVIIPNADLIGGFSLGVDLELLPNVLWRVEARLLGDTHDRFVDAAGAPSTTNTAFTTALCARF